MAKSKSLKKVFVSVKGVYFQAEVLGEPITWLVPHSFTQTLPREVDFRVMLTFLDFYEVFVRFALFKLYHMKTWQYPPNVNPHLEAEGCCLLSLKTDEIVTDDASKTANAVTTSNTTIKKKTKKELAKIKAIDVTTLLNKSKKSSDDVSDDESENEEEEEDEEEEADISIPLQNAFSDLQSFHATSSSSSTAQHTDNDADTAGGEEEQRVFTSADGVVGGARPLFHGLVFFVNREVPLDWCQLCITGFGGKIGWDGASSPITVNDPRITHHVIDRPIQGNSETANREYVQPQWIFDSINAGLLLPARLYAPGVKLPPHLSPFVNDDKEGYVPQFREEVKKLQQQQKQGSGVEGEEVDEEEEAEKREEFEEEDDFKKNNKNNKNNNNKKGKKEEEEEEESDDDNASDDEEDESVSDNEEEEEDVEELDELPQDNKKSNNSKKGPKAIVYQKKEAPVDEVRANR